MSRWITPFESHPFHSSWENLQNELKKIIINDATNKDIIIEIARLNKVIEYIDKYLKLIDPDINITSLAANLNNLNQFTNATKTEISNFIANNNITYLHRANNNIDNCLNAINAFHTILPKVSGQGIYSMLKKYNDTIDDALSEIDLGNTIEASQKINNLQEKLIDGINEEESIESKIDNIYQNMEDKHNQLLEYYNHTLNDTEYDNTTKRFIENAKEEIEKDTKISNEKLIEVSTKVDDLNKYYVKIFGALNDENERVGGLKSELEKRINNIDSFDKKQQIVYKETLEEKIRELTNYEEALTKDNKKLLAQKLEEINTYEAEQQKHNKNLFEQIESLLPHATSAGLAKAYETERNKFKLPIKIWNGVFIGSLGIMFYISYSSLENLTGLEDIGMHILQSLPIIAPLIWLAIFASIRRSENQRLEQEYAHKEALAKSYSSYKKQIDGLKQEDQVLLVKLLNSAIETISKNASDTLDKKHGDGTPIQHLTKTLIEEIKKKK